MTSAVTRVRRRGRCQPRQQQCFSTAVRPRRCMVVRPANGHHPSTVARILATARFQMTKKQKIRQPYLKSAAVDAFTMRMRAMVHICSAPHAALRCGSPRQRYKKTSSLPHRGSSRESNVSLPTELGLPVIYSSARIENKSRIVIRTPSSTVATVDEMGDPHLARAGITTIASRKN